MSRSSRGVCYQFQDNGHCNYDLGCKFSHPGSSRPVPSRGIGGQYPKFPYDPKRSVAEEFYRMCDFFAWDEDCEERKQTRRVFNDALVIRFNGLYGTDVADIENWHKLCVALYIEPLPDTIHHCKKKIKTIHVNLVDLVDVSRDAVELFPSLGELREYTIGSGKFFPKRSAYADGVLKFLLREIL
ncbi:hypothetical protein T440DRAFT_529394 [Plenodomus tracheiphilus IPT5]|uniref:C3H1-type domain-containing protein n=1 Tax=Plenodomus tracheiphilus IPT5 TaxID=1408161 RepID=A0A6A7ANU9_9PLEO|nr:hypothetical protein T440DRAFT_529394 [Plenodomus tracheiphilus IPT5]